MISQQNQTAKALVPRPKPSGEVTPFESAARSMQQRSEKYTERLAGISEKGLSHLESLEPAEVLDRAREIELHDRWSRRNYGLDHRPPNDGVVNLTILTGQAAIQIVQKPD